MENRIQTNVKRQGATLLEILVAIAVIAVLAALLLGPLRFVRLAAAEAKCRSNERSCFLAVSMYASDQGGFFPLFARPSLDNAFTNGGIPLDYWLQALHWPLALRGYLGWDEVDAVQFCPASPVLKSWATDRAGTPSGYVPPSDYWLSYTTISAPSVWSNALPPFDRALLRRVGIAEVAFPSSKGIMVEPRAYHLGAGGHAQAASVSIFHSEGADKRFQIIFADGSGRAVPFRTLRPGFQPDASWRVGASPVFTTPDGVYGRDLGKR